LQARKHFFLEKEAKTFARWGARWMQRAPKGSKVFWFFFFKKELLAFTLRELPSTPIDIIRWLSKFSLPWAGAAQPVTSCAATVSIKPAAHPARPAGSALSPRD
jgi:hypothetical protein